MRGISGLLVEIVTLIVAWMIYHKDYGTGAGSAIYMLWGVAIGAVGLVLGGIMGVMALLAGLVKNERISAAAAMSILAPPVVLVLVLAGVIRL